MKSWDDFTFRCSHLGKLMTDPRSKSEGLSETCKNELIDIYVSMAYDREKVVTSKFLEKGKDVEEDAITLLSLVTRKLYFKNEERLSNKYINGEPDLYDGESIHKASVIYDTKSSWDIFTFFHSKAKPVNKDYYWQMQGYMALTGAQEAKIVYCLIDTPDKLIDDEKKKLFYSGPWATIENHEYLALCDRIDTSMRYGDIPEKDRLFMQTVARNDDHIIALYDRIRECRVWMNENYPLIVDQAKITV